MAAPSRRRKRAVACKPFFPFLFFSLLLFLQTLPLSSSSSPGDGFVLPLLHRTSLPPPYNLHSSPLSKLDFLAEAKLLDKARYAAIASSLRRGRASDTLSSSSVPFDSNAASNTSNGFRTGVTSGASVGAGQYFVQLTIGTPPQKFMLIADTGSDLVWVRCSNCRRRCRAGVPSSPTFLIRASSTYRAILCLSQSCLLVPAPPSFSCNLRIPSTCRYDYTYTDTSESTGIFSTDTISLSPSSTSSSSNASSMEFGQVPDFAFGCGLRNVGQSFVGSDGVLGMGRGPISFVSQVGSVVGNKFAYCFVDFFRTPALNSSLILGELPTPMKLLTPLQSTPLVENPFGQSFYYVNVQEVRVNGQVLPISDDVWGLDATGNGGTVVDSGTTLTSFVEPAYQLILSAITEKFPFPQVEPVQTFDLCFNATGVTNLSALPTLSIMMENNAVFAPPVDNIFIDIPGGLKCLGLQGVEGPFGFSVLGNLIQQNFHMQFDLDSSTLSFARTRCSQ